MMCKLLLYYFQGIPSVLSKYFECFTIWPQSPPNVQPQITLFDSSKLKFHCLKLFYLLLFKCTHCGSALCSLSRVHFVWQMYSLTRSHLRVIRCRAAELLHWSNWQDGLFQQKKLWGEKQLLNSFNVVWTESLLHKICIQGLNHSFVHGRVYTSYCQTIRWNDHNRLFLRLQLLSAQTHSFLLMTSF